MAQGEPKFDNLVFEGGGVRGIAYAGALSALEEQGSLGGVCRVAGTSAGAFAALLISLGYSSDGVRDALRSIPLKTLEDKPNPLRIVSHYGFYKGDVLLEWITRQVTKAGLPEGLTFEGLIKRCGRELKVFATDLTTCNVREFSYDQTPRTSVVGAVRASMSIPLMYSPWQFADGEPDDHIYVDGGVVYNYPIGAFDVDSVCANTLGFRFTGNQGREHKAERHPHNLFEFSENLFIALMNAQTIDFEQDQAQVGRSVLIDDLGFRATDLSLSDDDFDRLYSAGYQATKRYLEEVGAT